MITETAVSDLITWYNDTLPQEPSGLAVSCEFTFRFLAIHPFQDGNGRLGRGLFLLSLLQSPNKAVADLAPYLALDRQIEKHKEEYYTVLNKCSDGKFLTNPSKYNTEHFLHFMVKVFEESLDDIETLQEPFYRFHKTLAIWTQSHGLFQGPTRGQTSNKRLMQSDKTPPENCRKHPLTTCKKWIHSKIRSGSRGSVSVSFLESDKSGDEIFVFQEVDFTDS